MVMKTARRCLAVILMGMPYFFTNMAPAQSLALVYELKLANQTPTNLSATDEACSLGQALAPQYCRIEIESHSVSSIRWKGTYGGAEYSGPQALDAGAHDQLFRSVRVAPNNVNVEPRSPVPSDVTLWLGTRYRLRSYPDSSESQRFMDARYETWAQRKALNSLGLELLFPFH
jgi:hypothetical protein